jgi:hypothetical protein
VTYETVDVVDTNAIERLITDHREEGIELG